MKQDSNIKINQLPLTTSHLPRLAVARRSEAGVPRAVNSPLESSIFKRGNLNYQRFLTGFTLIEMVVTIGIFALVTTLMLANFRQGQKIDDFKRGTIELVSNIRKVQTLGMSGQVATFCTNGQFEGKNCQTSADCVDSVPHECESAVPQGGYGIIIEPVRKPDGTICKPPGSPQGLICPTTYTLFVDTTGILGAYEPNPPNLPPYFDFPLAGGLDYSLPDDVYICDYDIQCSWGQAYGYSCTDPDSYGLHITFRPPKPTPYFYTPAPAETQAWPEQTVWIRLKHAVTNNCKEIRINGVSGEVSETVYSCADPCL